MTEKIKLWKEKELEDYFMEYYPANNRTSKAAAIIFPGGGYELYGDYEGKDYAEMFNRRGIDAFVVFYRIKEQCIFPNALNDARRAVRLVRSNADKYGIDTDKIIVVGSSAGGHLISQLCTNFDVLEKEGEDSLDSIDFLPNYQVLCYPVIDLTSQNSATRKNYVGEDADDETAKKHSANYHVKENTPPAFIWHTFEDAGVPINQSMCYVEALKEKKINTEYHLFPFGNHGLGMADRDWRKNDHVAQWTGYLKKWLELYGLIRE